MLKFGYRLLGILQVVSRLCLCSYVKAGEEFPFPLCTFCNHKHTVGRCVVANLTPLRAIYYIVVHTVLLTHSGNQHRSV